MTKRFLTSLLFGSMLLSIGKAYAADPSSVIQMVDTSVHAVSIVDLISKGGRDAQGHPNIYQVPLLRIASNCEDCKLSNALRFLIAASYRDVAQQHQLEINVEEVVTLHVDGLHARNSVLRGFLGVMAGADYIKAHLDQTSAKEILEYSVSHEEGIEPVAQRVGERALQYLIEAQVEALASSTKP